MRVWLAIACSIATGGLVALVATDWGRAPSHQPTDKVLGSAFSLADAISGTYERPNEAGKKSVAKKPQKVARAQLAKCASKGCKSKKRKEPAQTFADGYRTVCVRLCDGYYFPISASAQPSRFEADEAICQNTCSSPAKLFVYRNRDGSPQTMLDLDGQPYSQLTTAFKHLTAYDASCTCKPKPWSEEAANQHRVYELEARVAEGRAAESAELDLVKAAVVEARYRARLASGAEDLKIATSTRRAEQREARKTTRQVTARQITKPVRAAWSVRAQRSGTSMKQARARVVERRGAIRVSDSRGVFGLSR